MNKSIVIQFFKHLTCFFSTSEKSLMFYKPFLPNIETESVVPDILSIIDGPYYSSVPQTVCLYSQHPLVKGPLRHYYAPYWRCDVCKSQVLVLPEEYMNGTAVDKQDAT